MPVRVKYETPSTTKYYTSVLNVCLCFGELWRRGGGGTRGTHRYLCLDEADRMVDLGFEEEVLAVARHTAH